MDWFRHLLRPHSHEAADKVDAAMEASAEGMRAVPRLAAALVHADPQPQGGADYHAELASHR
jgi:hypothetical protein